MHIRYKPRISLGIVSQRDVIDYATRYAPRTSTVTSALSPTPTLGPIAYTPPIMVPIKQPSPFAPLAPELIEAADFTVPDGFRYSPEQLRDMLIRGASETFERSGEDEQGLPFADDLEQKSREIDATKQYGVDARGALLPGEAPAEAGKAVGWLLAAVAGYFLLGG